MTRHGNFTPSVRRLAEFRGNRVRRTPTATGKSASRINPALLSVAPIATTGVFALSPATGVDACMVKFTIDGVGNATVYQVGVQGYQPTDFTKAQMAANNWTASLTIAS